MEPVLKLSALRKAMKLTQHALSEMMGLKKSAVYQMERREVLQTNTLRAYVEALGGKLQVTAELDGTVYLLRPFSSAPDPEDISNLAVTTILDNPTFLAGIKKLVTDVQKQHSA
ncbi:MAG: helix-turn-helix transcriptional regulator [Candidatus Paceibacterota bacterium]|jgi:transcriptional regulator with XRE-family HTH domain